MKKKNVCVLVADGSEEMEVVIVVDVLRRAGVSVFWPGWGRKRGWSPPRVAYALRRMAHGIPRGQPL